MTATQPDYRLYILMSMNLKKIILNESSCLYLYLYVFIISIKNIYHFLIPKLYRKIQIKIFFYTNKNIA